MERGKRRELEGTVVSDRMDKTRVVAIERWRVVRPYGKRVRVTKKVKAHDEGNSSSVGDRVLLVETRPLSREKRWRIAAIIEKAAARAGGELGDQASN